MNNKVRFTAGLMACVVLLCACGCSGADKDVRLKNSKEELIQEIDKMYGLEDEYIGRIMELEELLRGIHTSDKPKANISDMGDGTGRKTFESFDGSIEFDYPLQYPNSTQAANNGSIKVVAGIEIKPANNWSIVMDGTTTYFKHISGIDGKISVGAIPERQHPEILEEQIFKPFIEKFPPSHVSYTKIYLEENWRGLQAIVPSRIDGSVVTMRFGMVPTSELVCMYGFVYQGETDSTKEEAISLLLQTILVNGQKLRLEN